MQIETKKRIANLTSNILNPFQVSLVIILLISFASVSTTSDALRWALVSMAVTIFPVIAMIIYFVRKGSLDAIFTNTRKQRTRIYLPAGLCAIAGGIMLVLLEAPPILIAAFAAGISTVIIFMCINMWWKISVHTGFIAGSVAVLVILYGWMAAITVPLVPLTAWSRIELEHHSVAQATTGAFLAALIVTLVFYPLAVA